MRNEIFAMLVIFISISCLGVCLSSITVIAQSSITAQINEEAMPGAYIIGYVLDEDGNPVPGADVSLWQNGQLWNSQQYGDYSGKKNTNPQTTRITYVNAEGFVKEGGFLFDLPYPDEYTIIAEKGRYKGSANVSVGQNSSSSVMVNITLDGYYQPTFTPEQLSYTGAIVGEVRNKHGYRNGIWEVSLWQDDHLVKMPNNPQAYMERTYYGTQVSYVFEHLAPGRYTVLVPYLAYYYNENVSVDVNESVMRADIVLSRETAYPDPLPYISFTPTVGVFVVSQQTKPNATVLPSTIARPTPALPGIIVVLIIAFMAILSYKK